MLIIDIDELQLIIDGLEDLKLSKKAERSGYISSHIQSGIDQVKNIINANETISWLTGGNSKAILNEHIVNLLVSIRNEFN